MKRLATTLGVLLLALGACGGGRPAHAQVRCTGSGNTMLCADAGTGTYYATTSFGRIQGQCSSGAKWDQSVPFVMVAALHRDLCGAELDYVR